VEIHRVSHQSYRILKKKNISLVVSEYLELKEMGSMEKDEEEEDENIKFSKRVMILISKSNQGSIPKVFYI